MIRYIEDDQESTTTMYDGGHPCDSFEDAIQFMLDKLGAILSGNIGLVVKSMRFKIEYVQS